MTVFHPVPAFQFPATALSGLRYRSVAGLSILTLSQCSDADDLFRLSVSVARPVAASVPPIDDARHTVPLFYALHCQGRYGLGRHPAFSPRYWHSLLSSGTTEYHECVL